ncbi:uncharacterized protein PGTG_12799 [Puccinia graminis f. sp. tritici CRL 75-36-700-3]|uniref:Uncharacterized protein n=1 Tax=Puccinia graminis f. sp. tritici (strain CRL 75-36-700-3 / race SCCL) TaxID=418459 RepID=E3KSC9_PUCGT|nr:uncharacterized protein PGTG_12799 [Puccinia graminis f. sp. tritici CRL 75-36-700-3]EFP87215.1 hypothetical protein PGTG_12799 [Puccinia graminis f. sp. tritici CRL 75-36-700-3]
MESLKFEQELRQADADCITKLEEAILQMKVKLDPETQLTRAETVRINLQRFQSSDGCRAIYNLDPWCPDFFATKGVTHEDNKIQLIGGLIRETNTTTFYASGFEGFLGKPWTDFKAKLIAFALPPNWRTMLQGKFKNLQMHNYESFLA